MVQRSFRSLPSIDLTRRPLRVVCSAFALLTFVFAPGPCVSAGERPADHTPDGETKSVVEGAETENANRLIASQSVSLAAARDRAKLLHHVYASSLEMMHRRYFHGERAAVPARAMEDVFTEVRQQSGVDARWIAVTLEAMSINHKPKTDFEKHATRELKSGKNEVDTIADGYYRRAVAIPLRGGCIHCHDRSIGQRFTRPVAGLVISIPLKNSTKGDRNSISR